MATTFDDLQRAYASSPAALFTALDTLDVQATYDLLLANVQRGLRANRLDQEEDEVKLPREFKRAPTRWSLFGYQLQWFDREQLERYMAPHLALNIKGSTYLRDALALLVWKSINTASPGGVDDDFEEFAADVEAERELISGASDTAFIKADGEGEPQITDDEENAGGSADTLAGLTRAEKRAAKKQQRAKAKSA